MFTYVTQCSSELYNQLNILIFFCFSHRALWYSNATWTNEMRTFQINTLIQFSQFFMFSTCSEPSWEWTHEVWNVQIRQKFEKLNHSINLKIVHFLGSCYIRIFWHYGQSKQTSLHLILISLLFDDSCKDKKGTCPSDLAVELSGWHNTHLVTLISMSVAH